MRTRSRLPRVGVCAIVSLVSGCDTGSAQVTTGTIVATVSRNSPPVPAAGAQVTLVGTVRGSITNISGTAAVSNVLPGTYQVRGVFIGYCVSTVTATVTAGATTAVSLHLGSTPCGSGGRSEFGGGASGGVEAGSGGTGGSGGGTDRVSTGGSEPLYGLVDIRTGSAADPAPCENDRLIKGTAGSADLLTNALVLTDPSVPCHGAAWVFTANHAPWFGNAAGTFLWTNSGGDVLTVTLPANRLRLPVTFWLTDFPGKVNYRNDLITSLLPDANNFLYRQKAGLILTNSETADNLPDIVDVGSLSDGATGAPDHPVIGKGCSNTSQITNSPAVYKPQHLNVYVVEGIEDGPSGINCVSFGSTNVMFVDFKRGFENLLHEIGHGLGLFWPNWGHADGLQGMFPANLMVIPVVDGSDLHVSLGQIARMHAEASSWLNQPNGSGTVRSRQFPSPFVTSCSCPGNAPTADCPGMQTDVDQAGSPYAGIPSRACHMTRSVGCISLAGPGATAVFTANGWIDAAMSAPGFGIRTIGNLSPSVATVSLSASTPSSMQLTVTGVSTGETNILLSLGGVFTNVTVKVGSTCV
jgi:hypothetical protein